MPQLTHFALSTVYIEDAKSYSSEYLASLIAILTHPSLQRIVFGWTPFFERTDVMEVKEAHQKTLMSLPENNHAKVVFLIYGDQTRPREWFTDRVIDGTIWHLEA